MWMAYSIFKFISYVKMRGATHIFLGASINIVGVALAYPIIAMQVFPIPHPLLLILPASAIMAAVSFYKMRPPE